MSRPPRVSRPERRVLAAVATELPLALARRRSPARVSGAPPLVILSREEGLVIGASSEALARGVRVGQSGVVANAHAAVRFATLARSELHEELERIAESLSDLAPTVAIALAREGVEEGALAASDTVWLDVTGVVRRGDAEQALAREVVARVEARSITARVAIASGPRVARALARHEPPARASALAGERESARLGLLPVEALVSDERALDVLARLGLRTLLELTRLPRGELVARGGAEVAWALDRLDARRDGRDRTPLAPWSPSPRLIEEQRFDEGFSSREGLLFVTRSLLARLAARLLARGQATGRLRARLTLDPAWVRWEASARADRGDPRPLSGVIELELPLPAPLFEARALFSTLSIPIERVELPADVVAVAIEAAELARAERVQLALTGARRLDPARLTHLFAELRADLGPENVGVFVHVDAHPPERKAQLSARLEPRDLERRAAKTRSRAPSAARRGEDPRASSAALRPTRLVDPPYAVELRGGDAGGESACAVGARLLVEGRAYEVERIDEVLRLEGVEWWRRPISRAYRALRLAAIPSRERSEALVFVEPASGRVFLHGWFE